MSITRNLLRELEIMENVVSTLSSVQRKVKRVKKQLDDKVPDSLYAVLRHHAIRLKNTIEDLKLEIRSDFPDRVERIRFLRTQAAVSLQFALHQLAVLVSRLPVCDADLQLRYGRLVKESQKIPSGILS